MSVAVKVENSGWKLFDQTGVSVARLPVYSSRNYQLREHLFHGQTQASGIGSFSFTVSPATLAVTGVSVRTSNVLMTTMSSSVKTWGFVPQITVPNFVALLYYVVLVSLRKNDL